jgi:hypothetical protein
MSPTPERVNAVLRMFAPLVIGTALLLWGAVQSNGAVIAIGAGLLGAPGLTGTLAAHQTTETPKGAESHGGSTGSPRT